MNDEAERRDRLTLEMLDLVERDQSLSQRGLAERLGVALGLANAYLRRCVRKGLIKVRTAPANRYLYYLTPKGFAEKGRLTARYLSYSFTFYRDASASLARVCAQCQREGRRRIVFAGVSELAEIALLRAREAGLEVVAVVEVPDESGAAIDGARWFHGLPVVREFPEASHYDVCVVTALALLDEAGSMLRTGVAPGRLIAPDILRLRWVETSP